MESLLLVMPRMVDAGCCSVRFPWGRAFSLEFDPQNIEGAAQVISEALKPLGLVLDENVQSGGSGTFNLFGLR